MIDTYSDYSRLRPRPRKVKHVKFFKVKRDLTVLENEINQFADSNPAFKILGIKLTSFGEYLIATVTYLEDCNGADYNSYDDEEDSD